MKVLLFLALILNIYSFAFAGELFGIFDHPDHPGKCVFNSLILSSGEQEKLPQACGLFICGPDGFGVIKTCEALTPPEGYRYEYVDINAPYDECCRRELVA